MEQKPVPACARALAVAPPEVIEKSAFGGHQAEQEEEHETEGNLLFRRVLDHHGVERSLYVGEHDVARFDDPTAALLQEEWTARYERYERGLAEVVARTGSTLPVFAVFAPSETKWRGMNKGKRFALINIGHDRSAKAYKWTIIHELAHQKGSGHDAEFNREFQVLAELVDTWWG